MSAIKWLNPIGSGAQDMKYTKILLRFETPTYICKWGACYIPTLYVYDKFVEETLKIVESKVTCFESIFRDSTK